MDHSMNAVFYINYALVAIVLIRLIEAFDIILEGISSEVYPGIVDKSS
jgi:hypothetical protein